MSGAHVLEADLIWTGGRFETGVRVTVGEDGRIAAIRRTGDSAAEAAAGAGAEGPPGEAPEVESAPALPVRRLPDRALLPGFVNAHSHAFQRGLRGRGETFPAGAGDFWSWRREMYGLVSRLDRDALFDLSLAAFREMRAAGITAVGEFHYLHHENPGDLDFAFDDVVLAAAAAAPIRIVLLQVFYAHGGIGEGGRPEPLTGGQLRFATPDEDGYWAQMDRLGDRVADDPRQSLGAVAHSIRAATPDQVARLHAEAVRRGLPFHMHVEEQVKEIEDCVAAYGAPPMALLLDRLELGDPSGGNFTAVHCTHTDPAHLERFVAVGGHPCVCPLTEANLGDGIPPLAALWEAAPWRRGGGEAGRLCLGSDSNARISMLEEARWLEYGQRLAAQRRGVLRATRGDGEGEVAPGLLTAATSGGAASLGIDAGRIEPGAWADFVTVDLGHPRLAGSNTDTLAAALVFGGGDSVLAESCLAGDWAEAD